MLRIGTILKKYGYYSIIKRHPDRIKESGGLYNEFYDEISSEKYEEAVKKADVVIFPNIATSTFTPTIRMNKPIVLFSTIISDVFPDVYTSLVKRCSVVKSEICKDSSKLKFDEKDLIYSLKSACKKVDDSSYIKNILES